MKTKLLTLICLCSLGCGTSYKVAPSTSKIETRIAVAKQATHEARDRTAEITTTTRDTAASAKTTSEHIDAAAEAMAARDYIKAADEMARAKISNELVEYLLRQSLRSLESLGASLRATEENLADAENNIAVLNKKIAHMTEQGAADHAIVKQVNWGFGIGAFLYGIKRILTFGFFGMLILAGAAIVLMCIGGPCALFITRSISALFLMLKNRKG